MLEGLPVVGKRVAQIDAAVQNDDFREFATAGLKLVKAIANQQLRKFKELLLVMRSTRRLPPASRPRPRQKVLLVSSRLHTKPFSTDRQ